MKYWFRSQVSKTGMGLSLVILSFMAALWLAATATERRIEQAIGRDFTAASALVRLQLEAERMRRFEKEAIVHANDAQERARYAAEFDRSFTQLLALLDTMQAPSGQSFTEDDRAEMAQWKAAALKYGARFVVLERQVALADHDKLSAEQSLRRAQDFNARISEGKNAFRGLLSGAEALRQQKEAGAHAIGRAISELLLALRLAVVLVGLSLIGLLLYLLRPIKGNGHELPVLHTVLAPHPAAPSLQA